MNGKCGNVYTVEYYSALKRNEILTHATWVYLLYVHVTWMNLEDLCQVEKARHSRSHIYIKCPE